MELKFNSFNQHTLMEDGSNRTFMELKFSVCVQIVTVQKF